MDLPFTADAFLDLFREYNTAIWPAPVIAYLLGFTAVALALRKRPASGRTILAILALFWIWMGAVYHLMFFSAINRAALLFGGLFIAQGILFLIAGLGRRPPGFGFSGDAYGAAGSLFILYAVLIYPVLGTLLGHGYPYAPMFGVAPCPTTIFTFGILLWVKNSIPAWLLIIPLLWSFVGFSAALNLGMREDFGLLVAGLAGASLLLYRNRRFHNEVATT